MKTNNTCSLELFSAGVVYLNNIENTGINKLNDMDRETSHWDAVIIGGGQAGLATGYFLKKMNSHFIILDDKERIGDSWRKRWDSLKLFTPAQHDGLPGFPFPGARGSFPGKEEMADYLERYAKEFMLPIQSNTKVEHLYSRNNHFEIETSSEKMIAHNVVIATGTNPFPKIPALSSGLSRDIFQIHSSAYINADSIPQGDVLVVGAARSGIEIALEVSKTHTTFISGRPTFHVPDKVIRYGGELLWWILNNIVTERTPIGRKAKEKIKHGGSPLIMISADDLKPAGVKNIPRVAGTKNGFPMLEDDSIIRVRSVIWATGYRPDFSWIEPDVTDESGWPLIRRGVSSVQRGLYFVGMPFQYGLTSGFVDGVERDAAYISRYILNEHK
jgi:putative flavoprotein involved in K+ transport